MSTPTTRPTASAVDSRRAPGRGGPTTILAIILVGYFMILLDNSIVITGLPSIQTELGFSTVGLSWVTNAYTLVFGGLLLLGARAGDLVGRRRMFTVGLTIFAVASLLIGLAPSAAWLVAARALQGVGAAILAPSTLSLLTASFPEGRERTRAISAYGAVAGIGAAAGLVLGGVLAEALSWRVGFLVNVPIGIVLIVAGRRYLAETPRRPGSLDLPGALASTLGMSALTYGIVRAASDGWTDAGTVVALAAGVLLLVGLVLLERRAAQPIMPLRLFASRVRSGAYAARLLFVGAVMGYFFFVTQFLQGVFGYDPLQAGLAFLPMTVVNFVVALAVPALTRRFGNGALVAAGLAVTAAGMGWLSRVGPESSYVVAVALPMAVIGIGLGLGFGPLTAAGVEGAGAADAGAASGVVNAAHQIGGSLGVGILVVAAASGAGATPVAELADRVGLALSAGTVMLVLGLVLALVLVVPARARRPVDRAEVGD